MIATIVLMGISVGLGLAILVAGANELFRSRPTGALSDQPAEAGICLLFGVSMLLAVGAFTLLRAASATG